MAGTTDQKRRERENKDIGLVFAGKWICKEDKTAFDAMVQRAKDRVSKLKDGETDND